MTARGRLQWVGIVAALAVGIVFLAVHAARERRALRAAHPVLEGRLAVTGPQAPLRLLRDARGIPHVVAASEHDAWFGLGFAHAQDRIGQLLWLRRAARGELAAWVGEAALSADRRARTLGIGRHADASVVKLPAATRRALEAYAAGVNARLARIARGEAALPPALARLGVEPAPWRPGDSLAVLKLFAWGLGGTLEEALVLEDLIERFGATEAAVFFPERPEPGARPVRTAARRGRDVPEVASPWRAQAQRAPAPGHPLRRVSGLHGVGIGSVAFAVGGAHAARGHPLLAADAHFAPSVPAALHEVHLRGGALDVAGATLPGTPVFWIGRNPEVAWAAVNARAAVSELFVETLRGDPPERFHDGRRWRALREREETIEVRGGAPEVLRVRETRHGPLVNDLLPGSRAPLALHWTGAEPGDGASAFLGMARANDAEALRRALAAHHEPVISVVYVSADGDAGMQLAGFVPQRGLATQLLPVPARDRGWHWDGAIAPGRLPSQRIEGGRGFVVAADGPFGAEGESAIEWLWRPGDRTRRAEALLERATAREGLTHADLVQLQLDAHSSRARDLIAAALAVAAPLDDLSNEAERTLASLREWDHEATPGSVGASVYHVFLEELLRAMLEPRLGPELLERYLALGRVSTAQLVDVLVTETAAGAPAPSFVSKQTVRAAVRTSLRDTWHRLSAELGAGTERWTWGRLHRLRFEPLLALPEAPEPLGPHPYGGDGSSLLAGGYAPLESFAVRTVASHRFVIDASDLDEALTSLAPGQSEHAGHPHAESGLQRWLEGRPRLLATSPLAVEEGAVQTLVLEPAS